jgi:hypothetical protein
VKLEAPVGVAGADVASVSVEVAALLPGVTVAGANEHVAPAGKPVHDNVTGEPKLAPVGVTVTVYVALAPRTAVADAGDTATENDSTVVTTLALEPLPLLLLAFGSAVVAVDEATFVNDPLVAGAVTTTVRCTLWPFVSVNVGHVTVPDAAVPPLEALTNATPAGRTSVMTTPAAELGPLFVTVSVYVKLAPAATVAGPDFATWTSACSVTVVTTCAAAAVPLLLAALGSTVVAVDRATLSNDPAATGAVTVTVR